MPDARFDQLNAGDPAQDTDLLPIERSGSNYYVTAGTVAQLAVDFVFPTTAAGDLIFTAVSGSPAVLTPTVLPIGSEGDGLTVVDGLPAWTAPLTLPELLVEPPEHYNSDGVAGQLAIGNDGGSPPNPAFFICLVTGSAEASPPTTALWLMVNDVGVFSTSF
jgi:hypothetical protein